METGRDSVSDPAMGMTANREEQALGVPSAPSAGALSA
jgi:hypothetical protein